MAGASAAESRSSSRLRRARTRAGVLSLAGVVVALEACISLDGLTGGTRVSSALDATTPFEDASSDAPAGDGGRADRYRTAILADSPLAYWRLDELTGTTAADEKGAHPGVYKVGPTLGATGIFGDQGAIVLPSGSNAHVEVPGTDFSFAENAPYSVEIWVKPTKAFKDYDWIVSTEITPPRTGWSVMTSASGELLFEVWRPTDSGTGEVRSLSSNRGLALDRFQHVVVTYNGSGMRAYIDGTLATSNPAPSKAPADGVLLFGCRRNVDGTVGGCLDGWSLDEVAIYDYVLSEDQVLAHHDLVQP